MSEQGTPLRFGRTSEQSKNLPILAPDLIRSYQWPFLLRVHPDRWEFVNGEWQLEIERSGLRPGSGGVGGRPTNLDSISDTALRAQWAKEGDRKWELVGQGEKAVRGLYQDGQFLKSVDCMTPSGQSGRVIIAVWERVTLAGKVESDPAMVRDLSRHLASELWGISGPTERAVSSVVQRMSVVLQTVQASADRQGQGGTQGQRKRLARLRTSLAKITGDDSYLVGIDGMAAPTSAPGRSRRRTSAPAPAEPTAPPPPPPPAQSKEEQLAALAASFGGAGGLLKALQGLAAAEAGSTSEKPDAGAQGAP